MVELGSLMVGLVGKARPAGDISLRKRLYFFVGGVEFPLTWPIEIP